MVKICQHCQKLLKMVKHGDKWSKMANKSYFFSKNGKISSKFSNFSAWVTGLVGLFY